jgi:hypothetical protein
LVVPLLTGVAGLPLVSAFGAVAFGAAVGAGVWAVTGCSAGAGAARSGVVVCFFRAPGVSSLAA